MTKQTNRKDSKMSATIDTVNRSKCEAYQNGRRCSAPAQHEMHYSMGRNFRHLVACDNCAKRIYNNPDASNVRFMNLIRS